MRAMVCEGLNQTDRSGDCRIIRAVKPLQLGCDDHTINFGGNVGNKNPGEKHWLDGELTTSR